MLSVHTDAATTTTARQLAQALHYMHVEAVPGCMVVSHLLQLQYIELS
jgi:hypothetical protein